MDDLINKIKNLSISERIILVEEIWDSIALEEQSFNLTEKQKEIIQKRAQNFKDNSALGRDWEEIKKEFLGK